MRVREMLGLEGRREGESVLPSEAEAWGQVIFAVTKGVKVLRTSGITSAWCSLMGCQQVLLEEDWELPTLRLCQRGFCCRMVMDRRVLDLGSRSWMLRGLARTKERECTAS